MYIYIYIYRFVSDKPALLSDRPLAFLVTRHAAAHRETWTGSSERLLLETERGSSETRTGLSEKPEQVFVRDVNSFA